MRGAGCPRGCRGSEASSFSSLSLGFDAAAQRHAWHVLLSCFEGLSSTAWCWGGPKTKSSCFF